MRAYSNEIGEKGEEIVVEKLSQMLPKGIEICWTRLSQTNHPFDIILWEGNKTIACIEVKTLAQNRVWYWTQYKRPAIRKKMKFASEASCGLVFTIAVRLGNPDKISYVAGLPSMPVENFEPDLKRLIEIIESIGE